MDVNKSKKERNRRGCLTCRHRKVKCDEMRDICSNCHRLRFLCQWDSDSVPRRSRTSRACARCREKKLRCIIPEGAKSCQQCDKIGQSCRLLFSEADQHQKKMSREGVMPAADIQIGLPQQSHRDTILDAYFSCPHYFCFLTFIHRPSFTKMLQKQLIPRPLFMIMLAIGLRHIDPGSHSPSAWADECRKIVVDDIFSKISTMNLQVLLLLQHFEWHRGSHLSAWFIAALATRLAHALQLNIDPADIRVGSSVTLPIPVMETRRRLVWSCYVMESIPDIHHSGNRPLHGSLDPLRIRTQLPGDEHSYEHGLAVRTRFLSDIPETSSTFPSVSAYLINMVDLRSQVLKYVKEVKLSLAKTREDLRPWENGSFFADLQRKLDGFSSHLPTKLKVTELNNSHGDSTSTNHINLFTLHTMFHAAYTDLMRVGTHLERAKNRLADLPMEFIKRCRMAALEHAKSLISLIARAVDTLPTEADPFMSICSCLAIRTLVVERWDNQTELVPLTTPEMQAGLNKAVLCTKKTAAWSVPIRKLILAVSDLTERHGVHLAVDEIKGSMPSLTQPVSRTGSPALDVYGTFGSLQKARVEHDLETSQDPSQAPNNGIIPSTSHEVNPNITQPVSTDGFSGTLQQSFSQSPDSLQLAFNWADGTYDLQMAQNQLGWNLTDPGWGFDFGDSILDSSIL